MLPFTHDQFLGVFAQYNLAIFPAQIVAYLLGLVGVGLVLRPTSGGGRINAAILGVMWLWTGLVYHGLFFSAINGAALVFAAAFVLQAGLLVYFGIARNDLEFGRPKSLEGWIGAGLIAYAMVLYPLLGMFIGSAYPSMPIFGITPCPVTLFTFGLLLLSTTRVSGWLLVIPVLWSLIGGSAAFLLQVPQDWVLLLSGPLTVLLYYTQRKGSSNPAHAH